MAFALLVECQRDISLINVELSYSFVALKSIFQMFDKDDDGKITIQEMKNTLRAMGEILTEEEIDETFKSLDIDGQSTLVTYLMIYMTKDILTVDPLSLCCSLEIIF